VLALGLKLHRLIVEIRGGIGRNSYFHGREFYDRNTNSSRAKLPSL
jgi:hypothetical protein